MSARTTLVLLVLVVLAGGAIWWFTRGDAPVAGKDRRLLPGLVAGEVTSLAIRSEAADAPLRSPLTVSEAESGDWMVRVGDERPFRARLERVRATLELLREAPFQRELAAASRESLSRYGLAPGQRVVVVLTERSGRSRTLELGAQVSEGGVAARVDDGWPPVEVDRQIREDLVVAADAWRERRLAPFDSSIARSVRAAFPKRPDAGFVARRESGQWEIREPALMRADQGLVIRLVASLASLESLGAYEPEGAAAPEPLVRYEVEAADAPRPYVIEIGAGRKGDLVAARTGDDPEWRTVSLAGLEAVTQPGAYFRSRKLLHVEPADIEEIVVTRSGGDPLRLRRTGMRMFFEPPEEWGWRLLGRPRSAPLDPSAQADFLQLLTSLQAIDFEGGPAVEPVRTLVVRPKSGGPEQKIQFGPDSGGKRPFTRFGPGADGHVRASELEFLDRPYFELLARQAYTGGWFSLSVIEVTESSGRKVVIHAVSTSGGQPDFVLVEPRGDEKRRVPREVVNPVTDKICLLTVDKFVGHGRPAEFGLDKPAYRIRWLDSGKSEGVAPDPRTGDWVTWTVGPRDPDGSNCGEVSTSPGLIFKTGTADLDPFLNLVDWAHR